MNMQKNISNRIQYNNFLFSAFNLKLKNYEIVIPSFFKNNKGTIH
jgi:hypothetical protein